MKRRLTYLLLICLITILGTVSCQKDDPVLKNDGSISFQGNTYNMKQARLLRQNNQLQLVLYPSSMNITELGTTGYGALLKLEFNCDSTHLKPGTYPVNNSGDIATITATKSFFINIPESGPDTASVAIAGGQCTVVPGDLGNDYTFALITNAGDSIVGNFKGKYVYNNDTDGAKVGNVTIGTKSFDLQRGDLMLWYHPFDEALFYYEFYMYSTDLRYSDAGNIRSGLMFVIGLHSSDANTPVAGTYPIAILYRDTTALFGYKTSTYDWGCYWYNYLTSSASEKAFITEGEVTLERNANSYHFIFNFKDQLGQDIKGEYDSDFNIINTFQ